MNNMGGLNKESKGQIWLPCQKINIFLIPLQSDIDAKQILHNMKKISTISPYMLCELHPVLPLLRGRKHTRIHIHTHANHAVGDGMSLCKLFVYEILR